MEIAKNEIRIDVRNNPKLKEYFSRKEPGDKCTIEIDMVVRAQTEDAVIGTVESMAPSGYKEKDPETGKTEKEIEPSADDSLMVDISGE